MINKDFKIDFKKKTITYVGTVKKIYSTNELYSFLQDVFDEQENLKYDIPIVVKAKGKFKIINGWKIDKSAFSHINDKIGYQ